VPHDKLHLRHAERQGVIRRVAKRSRGVHLCTPLPGARILRLRAGWHPVGAMRRRRPDAGTPSPRPCGV